MPDKTPPGEPIETGWRVKLTSSSNTTIAGPFYTDRRLCELVCASKDDGRKHRGYEPEEVQFTRAKPMPEDPDQDDLAIVDGAYVDRVCDTPAGEVVRLRALTRLTYEEIEALGIIVFDDEIIHGGTVAMMRKQYSDRKRG